MSWVATNQFVLPGWCGPHQQHLPIYLYLFATSQIQQSGATGLFSLSSPHSRRGWPQPIQPGRLTTVPRGSGYRHRLTETDSKPCIRNVFLCSDTLHLICIFTYSDIGVGFLSVWDRAKTGPSLCFYYVSKVLCHWIVETCQPIQSQTGDTRPLAKRGPGGFVLLKQVDQQSGRSNNT